MTNSLHHSFDIHLAATYGVHEAIIIHHFQHWIRINKKLKKNFHEDRTWTYQTLDEIAAHFPYLSRSEVFEIIERLCTGKGRRSKSEKSYEPVLRKGNFNKKKFDRTTWYAFENEKIFTVLAEANMDSGSSQHAYRPEPTPIPDTKTHTKTNPPLPPPKVPDPIPPDSSPPTKEEEEEINKRLKERSKTAPRIASKHKWREKVLEDIRNDCKAKEVDSERFQRHKAQAESKEEQKWDYAKNFTVTACKECVEFTSGAQYVMVKYDVSDDEWRTKTRWS